MDQSHSFCDGPTSSLHHPSSSSSRPALHQSQSNIETRHGLLHLAAMELEGMRSSKNTSVSSSSTPQCPAIPSAGEEIERAFPPACLALLHSLPNNTKCHDCQIRTSSSSQHSSHNTFSGPATWASTSYGITLCLQCSGKHRSLGVQCSFIKSLTLDSWKRREILCMLEGGNGQLSSFFERHGMGDAHGGSLDSSQSGGSSCHSSGTNHGGRNQSNSTEAARKATTVKGLDRYKTKAASFYRQHLLSHAKNVAERDGLYEGREASRRRNSGGSNNSGSSGGSNKHSKNKKNCSNSGSSSKKKSNKGVGSGSPSCSSRKKKSRQMMLPTVTENKDVMELTVGV
ncbi:hypothetical protein ACHAXR_010933 [Thalassiosira sp. AJA248-18]